MRERICFERNTRTKRKREKRSKKERQNESKKDRMKTRKTEEKKRRTTGMTERTLRICASFKPLNLYKYDTHLHCNVLRMSLSTPI